MKAEYREGCPQRDSAEREEYAGARSAGSRELAEKDGAEYATTEMLTEAVAVRPRESVTLTVYVIVPLE